MKTRALVLDASAALNLLLPDEPDTRVEVIYRLIENGAAFYVPRHWLFEVTNGLLMAERRGRITAAATAAAMVQARALTLITLEENDFLDNTLSLARQHRLTIYDAAYLELAKRLDLPLATFDQALGKAAKATGVAVI
jgi:predicted nucleic acid-binding protein